MAGLPPVCPMPRKRYSLYRPTLAVTVQGDAGAWASAEVETRVRAVASRVRFMADPRGRRRAAFRQPRQHVVCDRSKATEINGLGCIRRPGLRRSPRSMHPSGAISAVMAPMQGACLAASRRGTTDPLLDSPDAPRPRSGRPVMINTAMLDDLARRIGQAIEASPAKDIEKNVKVLLQSGLAKLDAVP